MSFATYTLNQTNCRQWPFMSFRVVLFWHAIKMIAKLSTMLQHSTSAAGPFNLLNYQLYYFLALKIDRVKYAVPTVGILHH